MNDSRFYIDIEDSNGSRLGPGPITSALSWSVVRRASKAGSFAFAMPANDDLAPFVTAKRVASIYAVVNGAWAYVGGGIIDRISRQLDGAGRALLSVAGDDMLRELTYRTVGTAALTNGSGGAVTHATAVALRANPFAAPAAFRLRSRTRSQRPADMSLRNKRTPSPRSAIAKSTSPSPSQSAQAGCSP